jgi:hypothetical protein
MTSGDFLHPSFMTSSSGPSQAPPSGKLRTLTQRMHHKCGGTGVSGNRALLAWPPWDGLSVAQLPGALDAQVSQHFHLGVVHLEFLVETG